MKRPLPVYSSPRITHDDETILSTGGRRLQEHEERWSHMSHLAGSHQQDQQVLKLTQRHNMSPLALASGVPPQVASRIVELHLGPVDNLPEWLDVIFHKFTNLQHLYLDKDDATEAGRIRRLYILYRLPLLLTMDGRPVTQLERSLARPTSPNGLAVAKHDWIPRDEPAEPHGDAVQVSLHGVVQMIPADDIPHNEIEPPPPPPQRPAANYSHELIHYSKSLESAYRIVNLLPGPSSVCMISQDDQHQPCMPTTTAFEATCSTMSKEVMAPQDDTGRTVPLAKTNSSILFEGLSLCTTNEKYLAFGEDTTTLQLSKATSTSTSSTTATATTTTTAATTDLEDTMKQLQLTDKRKPPAATQVQKSSRPTTPEPPLQTLAPSTPEKVRRSPARSLSSPFPMQFRAPKVVLVVAEPELDTRTRMAKRPPPVPGREIQKPPTPNRLLGRWRGKKQVARAGRSMMDEGDSTSDDEEE
jgi:hypothetical protein